MKTLLVFSLVIGVALCAGMRQRRQMFGSGMPPAYGTPSYSGMPPSYGIPSFPEFSGNGNGVSDSCEGNCGGGAGMCWCDPICEQYGDCCDDKEDVCDRGVHHSTGMPFPTGSGMPDFFPTGSGMPDQFPMPGSGMPMPPKAGKPFKQ